MAYLNTFWFDWLGWPANQIIGMFGLDASSALIANGLRVLVLVGILFALWELWIYGRLFYRKVIKREDKLMNQPLPREGALQDSGFTQTVMAAGNLNATIAPLKKERRYDRIGEIYAGLNKPKEAAKWYRKAGDKQRAAMEMAKAGQTVAAAKLLRAVGDHETAGRFFLEKKKFKDAAKSFEQAGKLPESAEAFVAAKSYADAVRVYRSYFAATKDDLPRQLKAAQAANALLEDPKAQKALDDAARCELLAAVAERFGATEQYDVAAKLLRQAGNPGRAGEIFLRAGKLQEAIACMKEAGRERDATLIGARYYAQIGRWAEAGMAFEGAGEYRSAGDAFSRAGDAKRAAANYEKGGEFFGAGLALVHAKEWEKAVPVLQKVPEAEKNFPESRNLLGRCFYELRDYGHCVATLENHLFGEKVRDENINYFWMLALAYEQEGELGKSRDVLRKIRSVKVDYRDVSARLSNIESRISMAPQMNTPAGAMGFATGGGAPGAQMATVVESAIGTRYRIEKELGRGGMGVVYQAHDTQLDRPVALKFLGSLLDGSEEYRQRFLREARTAAKVTHPNIVSIYDISAEAGRAYIAMEFIEGANLHRYVKEKGRLSPREAVSIVGQACAALEAVHREGIVHRDIKPDNILIAKGGLVKLMDFGLAKGRDNRMTASNIVMGTPCYMSPEQTRGQDVDARSDIYSMGLVLHEVLTGKTVFLDGDVLMRQQTEMPDPPSALVPDLPEVLDQIVMKCIAKDPRERFQSAQELISYLRQVKNT